MADDGVMRGRLRDDAVSHETAEQFRHAFVAAVKRLAAQGVDTYRHGEVAAQAARAEEAMGKTLDVRPSGPGRESRDESPRQQS